MGKEYKYIPSDNLMNPTFQLNCQDIAFSGHVSKYLKLFFFFKDPGRLFDGEGPVYEKPFCPMLVFRKGTLSLARLLLDSILH